MRCEDKKRYSTKARAKQAASRHSKASGIELYVYKCPTCGFWHMTSQPQFLVKGAA